MEDLVNHPKHYTSHPSGVECIELTEYMPFCLGNATKYLWRAGLKTGTAESLDVAKAIWYLDRQLLTMGSTLDRRVCLPRASSQGFLRLSRWFLGGDSLEVSANLASVGVLFDLFTCGGGPYQPTETLLDEGSMKMVESGAYSILSDRDHIATVADYLKGLMP